MSLEGENLYFASKIILYLKEDFEINVAQQESVSSQSIQVHNLSLSLPSHFAESSIYQETNDYEEYEETTRVCLLTHFGKFSFPNVKVKHKVTK